MSGDAEIIRGMADEMKEAWVGWDTATVMSALTLVTAEALVSCDMKQGKDINTAMAMFDNQVRRIYALLTEDMRS